MSKREKLKQRLQRNPKNVSFRDLQTLLEAYGFELKRTKGSHHSFVGKIGEQSVLLTIPHPQPLKSVYVKHALELIDQVAAESEEESEEEDNDDE
jgi:predicted RNA binding protein YcfA (HicA-like mRNA interferase family)